MVTTQEIESLGWSFQGTYRKGGSKGFDLNGFHLVSHADNFISKKDEIKITQVDELKRGVVLFSDSVENKDKLIDLMVQFNIDLQLTREHKINKII